MKPFFEHDCSQCEYVGSGRYDGMIVDVYKACDKSSHTHILRFDVDGDYMTTDRAQNDVAYFTESEHRTHQVGDIVAALTAAMEQEKDLNAEIGVIRADINALQNRLIAWFDLT